MVTMEENRLAALVLSAALVVFLSLGGLFFLSGDAFVGSLFWVATLVSLGMLLWLVIRIRQRSGQG